MRNTSRLRRPYDQAISPVTSRGFAVLLAVWGGACAASPSATAPDAGGSPDTGGDTGVPSCATGGAGGSVAVVNPLPALHVEGNLIKDANGKTIVLRGSSLIDLGALSLWDTSPAVVGNNKVANRIEALVKAGLAGHVMRLPVYPRTNVNGQWPFYSPLPYPVGPAAPDTVKLDYAVTNITAEEYIATVLKPAVDYITQKGLYVIIDYHQIDDTTGTSAAAATTFWMQVAPVFKDYPNVIYEAFNEPIDISLPTPMARWEAYKPVAQGWVDTIRAAAPANLIIVGSPSWCQNVGPTATSPLTGTNLVYSAHIYPGNWNAAFKAQLDMAIAVHPIAVTEWGYTTKAGGDANLVTNTATWGTDLRNYLHANGASWTAWVADDQWSPPLFASLAGGTLTDFGMLTRDWLTATAACDWVQ